MVQYNPNMFFFLLLPSSILHFFFFSFYCMLCFYVLFVLWVCLVYEKCLALPMKKIVLPRLAWRHCCSLNTKMSPNKDKNHYANIWTKIPKLLCFQNGGGHCDVTSQCTSPILMESTGCRRKVLWYLDWRRPRTVRLWCTVIWEGWRWGCKLL